MALNLPSVKGAFLLSTPLKALPLPSVAVEATGSQAKTAILSFRSQDWHVHFHEKEDPVAFLEQMLEICTAQQIHPDGLIPQLPTLLRGHALLWFRKNRHRWSTWQQFDADFRAFYFPLDYADDLEAQISRRLQRQDESVSTYFTDLQTLICRHGGMTPEQESRWLCRNMTPQLRQMVRTNDFWNVFTLSQRAREAEHLLQEVRQTVTVNPSR